MTDTDMAQMPAAQGQNLAWFDYVRSVEWPVLGVMFGILCTIVWWAFLFWLLVNLFG
jgi:hypothetical protein